MLCTDPVVMVIPKLEALFYVCAEKNCASSRLEGPPEAFCSSASLPYCVLMISQERKLDSEVRCQQGGSAPSLVLGLVPQPRPPRASSLHPKGRGRRSRLVLQTPQTLQVKNSTDCGPSSMGSRNIWLLLTSSCSSCEAKCIDIPTQAVTHRRQGQR